MSFDINALKFIKQPMDRRRYWSESDFNQARVEKVNANVHLLKAKGIAQLLKNSSDNPRIKKEIEELVTDKVTGYCPAFQSIEELVRKACDVGVWKTHYRRYCTKYAQQAAVSMGKVGSESQKYVTDDAVVFAKNRIKAGIEFLNNTVAYDSETNESKPLSGITSAEKVLFESYAILKGLEVLAEQQKYRWLMLTLTTPAEFHANPSTRAGSNETNSRRRKAKIVRLEKKIAKLEYVLDRMESKKIEKPKPAVIERSESVKANIVIPASMYVAVEFEEELQAALAAQQKLKEAELEKVKRQEVAFAEVLARFDEQVQERKNHIKKINQRITQTKEKIKELEAEKFDPVYDGSTIREAHQYIATGWKSILDRCRQAGFNTVGFRTCEPHQDATPHWHCIIFWQGQDHLDLICRQVLSQFKGGLKVKELVVRKEDDNAVKSIKGTHYKGLSDFVRKNGEAVNNADELQKIAAQCQIDIGALKTGDAAIDAMIAGFASYAMKYIATNLGLEVFDNAALNSAAKANLTKKDFTEFEKATKERKHGKNRERVLAYRKVHALRAIAFYGLPTRLKETWNHLRLIRFKDKEGNLTEDARKWPTEVIDLIKLVQQPKGSGMPKFMEAMGGINILIPTRKELAKLKKFDKAGDVTQLQRYISLYERQGKSLEAFKFESLDNTDKFVIEKVTTEKTTKFKRIRKKVVGVNVRINGNESQHITKKDNTLLISNLAADALKAGKQKTNSEEVSSKSINGKNDISHDNSRTKKHGTEIIYKCTSKAKTQKPKTEADIAKRREKSVKQQNAFINADVYENIALIAEAGSGKSYCLAQRVAKLIKIGVSTNDILFLTFTNANVGDANVKLAEALKPNKNDLDSGLKQKLAKFEASTIHSAAAKIINSIKTEQAKQVEFLKQSANESTAKEIKKINALIQELKKASLNNCVAVAAQYAHLHAKRYHILIDEVQDLSQDQWDFCETFASNLTVVGDSKQRIYAWRNAKTKGLQMFADKAATPSKGARTKIKVFKLQYNRRSCEAIVEACNRVFNSNAKAIKQGGLVASQLFQRKEEEVSYAIEFAKERQGKCSILTRSNIERAELMTELMILGIDAEVLTIHDAKGGEWDSVLMMSGYRRKSELLTEEKAQAEELAYVACSRAINELVISAIGDFNDTHKKVLGITTAEPINEDSY